MSNKGTRKQRWQELQLNEIMEIWRRDVKKHKMEVGNSKMPGCDTR